MEDVARNCSVSTAVEPSAASNLGDEPVSLHTIRDHGSFISSICIYPKVSGLGKPSPVVASASWNNKVLFHDLDSGELLHTLDCPYGETISCLSGYCQPGVCELLATFSLDGKIRIYDGLNEWNLVKCFSHSLKPTRSVLGVVKLACLDTQPVCISGGIDKVLRVRDIYHPSEVLFTLRGHTDSILSIDFAESGVIASGSGDTNVRLWSSASGSFLRTLRGHILGVSAVRFIRESPWLISAGLDGTFRVWDYTTGQRLRLLKGNILLLFLHTYHLSARF
jgi:WD40 repeat protein